MTDYAHMQLKLLRNHLEARLRRMSELIGKIEDAQGRLDELNRQYDVAVNEHNRISEEIESAEDGV